MAGHYGHRMLDENVIEFLKAMGGGMLCTRNGECQPAASELILTDVTADRLIGIVPVHLGPHLPAYLSESRKASLVASHTFGDHRSVQVKGEVDVFEDAAVYDPAEFGEVPFNMARYYPSMAMELVRQAMLVVMSCEVFKLELVVSEVFDQTPGPKAGAPLGAQA